MQWSPDSWRSRPALQQPVYDSLLALDEALAQLRALPPLVTAWEIVRLETELAEAAQGRRFLLQGGDCAERFADCNPLAITNKLKVLLRMSLVFIQASGRPVIRVGRMAGQYAKPRSDDSETRAGASLPSYRGDLVNHPGFTAADRRPDPTLLLRGYERAALTLNYIRALVRGGFADLHHPEYWDLDFADLSPLAAEYRAMVAQLAESLRFMENVLGVHAGELEWVDFYTSHEALHLAFEQAQTHRVPHREGWYNLSTHFPWIGLRTSDPDGAHVEYCRGIANPIAVKLGPATTPNHLRRLLDILHPDGRPGRLTLVHRLGRARVADTLPTLIETVRRDGRPVLWVCDPMHGNTQTTPAGVKTRQFDDILAELDLSFDIHRDLGSTLGGVHFELTGDNVTECLGGARGLSEADLAANYQSEVDPRLNADQALEMALLVGRKLRQLASELR